MINFSEAYDIVINSVKETGTEKVDLYNSLDRILAQDVMSDLDMPPFDKSAMDGYACRSEDLEHELSVIEVVQAGCVPEKRVEKRECSKIMTGAMVPEGADCVVIVEETEETAKTRVRFTGALERNTKGLQKRKNNICRKGEDVRCGEVVLSKGEIIKPQHIAVLASVGCSHPQVSIRPRVGVISTGSELVEPCEKVEGPKIRNSNSYQLFAQIQRMGAVPVYYGIAEDTVESTDLYIRKAMAENNVVLVSGGVSMGDYDFVPEVFKKNGIKILFDQVAIQPGKPITFGVGENVICFGMPGNPVSTFVQFEILVKPFLYKMMEHDYKPNNFPLVLGETIRRKRAGREALIPAFIEEGKVFRAEYHGSAHINAMCEAKYLISLPVGVAEVKKGTIVDVRQI